MEKITLIIDGKNITCPAGTNILDAALENGIKIPNLCYHPDLAPFGACRLCLVEEEKTGRLMASCVTPAGSGMVVHTQSPRIARHRRNIVRLMMAEHPESCLVCSKGNRCKLREIAAKLGIGETNLYPISNYKRFEAANPFIIRDLSKCILCGKCIRSDHELVSAGAIDYNLRGFESRPGTVHDQSLENSNCTFCGTCVSMCPTGALSPKNSKYVGTCERESFSVCGFCSIGCSLDMGVASDKIVEVNPSRLKNTVNGPTLCIRGHFAHDYLNSEKRLTHPMVRKNGGFVNVSWQEAIEVTANRLLEIKRKNGPQSLAFFGSSKCTNEENYLFQKIARVVFETNNIDNGAYIYGQPLICSIDQRIKGGFVLKPLSEIEKAETILIIGADPPHSIPVAGYYIKRAVKKGTNLVVADPRQTELSNLASQWLRVNPGSDFEMINGISKLVYLNKAYNESALAMHTAGFELYSDFLCSLNIEDICSATGVDYHGIENAAKLIAGKKAVFLVGSGIFQQKNGDKSLQALFNLALITGCISNEKSGLYLLTRENNQTGACDMGSMPNFLPGRNPLTDDSFRKHLEKTWQASILPDNGMDIIQMVKAAEEKKLKALYIMGENPLRSLPQPDRVKEALKNLDFIVVQDILSTETTEIADVVLPGAAFCEKEGSFTNFEGRIQTFKNAVSPPGHAKPDWEILDILIEQCKMPFRYSSIKNIRNEIKSLISLYEDFNEDNGHVWLKDSDKKKSSQEGFRIPFFNISSIERNTKDVSYPFTAIIGSMRHHLGSGTRTGNSERISESENNSRIEISTNDAIDLNLKDGDAILIKSSYGTIQREVKIKGGLNPGIIFIPTGFNNNNAMNIVKLASYEEQDWEGIKTIDVSIEKKI